MKKVRFKTDVYNEIKRQLDAGSVWGRIPDNNEIAGAQSYSKEFLEVPYFIVRECNETSYKIVKPNVIDDMRVSKCHVIDWVDINMELDENLFEWKEL